MSIYSGFFNSVNGDRTYSADDLNYFFNGVMSDGIVKDYGSAFEVTVDGTGLTVTVLDGKAYCKGRYVENVGSMTLDIEGGGTLARYDAVVIGVNLTTRAGSVYIKKGTEGASPSYPTIENSATLKELCLAYIYVSAGATVITSDNITDERANTSISGWSSVISAKKLKEYRNRTTTVKGTNSYNIGINKFDGLNDILSVYKNGLWLTEDEYTLSGTGEDAYITLTETPTSNLNELEFVVTKME